MIQPHLYIYTKDILPEWTECLWSLGCVVRVRVLSFLDATLFDTSLFAGETTQVVQFGAANFAILVDYDGVDERRLDGEDTLNADVVGHFAYGEALFGAFARNFDNHTAVLLDTFLITFFDAVGHGDGIAGTEIGMLLATGKSLFGNLD